MNLLNQIGSAFRPLRWALLGILGLSACSAAGQPSSDWIGEVAPRGKRIDRPAAVLSAHPNWEPAAWGKAQIARWADLDAATVQQEDARTANLIGVPMRIGVNRSWPEGAARLWEGQRPREMAGRFLWTYRLNAPGAKALRVHFTRCDMPAGGELILADHAGRTVEVFAGDGLDDFWSTPVPGSMVYLEYRSPAGDSAAPAIEIDQISHIYRDPLMAGEPEENGGGVPQPQSFSCQLDVNCYAVPPSVRDAVGRLIYTTQSGTFKCTGTLLADLDPNTYAGYLLTANHCINTPAAAASLTVYWFYQTDVCNGTVPPLESLPRSGGSTLLATSTNSDFTLLRLWDDPNAGQGFAAWTTNSPGSGDTLASIHHPLGEYKRVSVGGLTSSQPICGSYPPSRFWYVDWQTGITETGSSGGPLFNANWEVVGQLYGTCSINTPSCTNSDDYNVMFGKFGVTYPSVAVHLESVTPDDAYEDNDTLAQAAPILVGTNALRLVDFDDYFTVTLGATATLTATATFNTGNLDLDLELLNGGGAVLESSSGASGTERVSREVPAGNYILRATKSHKWGGNYTLTLAVSPPAPNLTITSQGGGAYLIQLRGIPSIGCRIDYSEVLTPPNWQALASGTSSASGVFEWVDTPPPGTAHRYYRSIYP